MDDALGHCRNHRQPDFCQCKGRSSKHLAKLRRHIVERNALLAVGCNYIARDDGAPQKASFERLRRPFEANFALSGCEDHLGRRFRFYFAQFNKIASTHSGIGALQSVKPNHLKRFVLRIWIDRARGGAAFADNFDNIALHHTIGSHKSTRHAGKATT